ncbi:MAG: tetratricopeptide repeat protein [Bacteroidota bacterium]
MGKTLIILTLTFILAGNIFSDTKAQKNDQAKILQQIENGRALLEESPEEAVSLAEQALQNSLSVNFYEGEAKALLLKGKALNNQKDYENALTSLRAATNYFQQEGDDKLALGQSYFGQGYAFYRMAKIDSALQFLNKALNTFDPENHKEDIAHTEWRIALAYWKRGMYKEGLEHIQQAQNLFEEVNNIRNLSQVYNSKGAILWGLASYEKALEFFFDALSLNEKENINQDLKIILYNNIGLVYHDWNDHENALKYFERAENLIPESNHPIGDAYTWLNLGTHYLRVEDTEKALELLKKARDEYAEENDLNGVCLSQIRIGESYNQNGNFEKAQSTLLEAIETSQQTQNKHRESTAYYYLSKNDVSQNRLDEALQNSLKSLEISENGEYKELSNMLYEQLSEIHEKQGDTERALAMLQKAAEVKDEIYNERIAVQYDIMDLAYENEMKEYENERLKNENQLKEKTIRYQYVAFFSIIALLIVFAVFYLKLSKKKKELEQVNHTKDKIFSIVAHDIRGPVGTLNSMVDILVDEEHDLNYKEILTSYKPVIAGSFNMLENLLVWAKSNLGKLETSPVSHNLSKPINEAVTLFSHILIDKSITLETDVPENIKVFADEILLQTVIRNILSNAIKFTPRNGKIEVNAQTEDNKAIVSVTDNGIGIPQVIQPTILTGNYHSPGTNNENGSGLGLMLSKELAVKNGGDIWFTSQKGEGSTFYISVPLDS